MSDTASVLGTPAPRTPATTAPSQEDRLLAAAAYLSYFTGFWLVVPIVIYVLKRDKSRFVAHHALRAIVLHVVAIPVFVSSWVLGSALTLGLMYAVGEKGDRADDILSGAVLLVSVFAWVLPWLIYLAICGLAAVRGFQGRTDTRSLLGRTVERLLGQDRSVAA